MTELGGAGTSNCSYMPNVHGSIGFALPGAEARVAALDDASVTVPDGEPGELMIRGPLVMLGYYGNEPATKAAIEPDGWMHTGDIASRDDEGHYFIVDRKKDLIITGGFNVYPAEIERVVASHPAVAMVAVGSVPDETLGELARAYVVLRPGRHRHPGPDHRALPAAPGRVQAAPLRPVRARSAQDVNRQGDAQRAEDPRPLRPAGQANQSRAAGRCVPDGVRGVTSGKRA